MTSQEPPHGAGASDTPTFGGSVPPPWAAQPSHADATQYPSSVDGRTASPEGSGDKPSVRWAVILIALSLVMLTLGGTLIAILLRRDSNDVIAAPDQIEAPSTRSPDRDTGASPERASATSSPQVTLADRSSAPTTSAGGQAPAPPAQGSTSPSSNSGGGTAPGPPSSGAQTLGPVSFDVPSGFNPSVVGELQPHGALRSEFVGPGGQKIILEINVGNPSDPLASAQELAINFRDQGRLIAEPYDADVDGTSTAVLAVRGSDGDYRSDHFLIHDGSGMAVMGVDVSSFDVADELARGVIPTVT